MKMSKREKLCKRIKFLNKLKPSSNYVIHNKGQYICVDPCGWPVFDDKLYPRTTKFIKDDAEIYVKNLKLNGYKNLEIEKLNKRILIEHKMTTIVNFKPMGELNENL